MNGGGSYYSNMYPTQPGYYPVPGQAFYPAPAPGGYAGYPPPGRIHEFLSQKDFCQLSVLKPKPGQSVWPVINPEQTL